MRKTPHAKDSSQKPKAKKSQKPKRKKPNKNKAQ